MTDAAPTYRVLARAYRPSSFDELIGQEVLVRTLTNAFASGRLAQAYMLSGVRGIGKTTTARIIARALNCVGPDGTGGPTATPCGVCDPCRRIAEDRHVDVLEIDAASHTGVDDIRELIEAARYRPAEARYRVYVIDEVHMLSKSAFNALLKTLEEPPDHVRFVFATTEIRKVPVTVLSRCQRFDLRRVDADTLASHLTAIVAKEGAEVADAAIRLIARAADGSVRDGLSLLDQAIAHGGGRVDEAAVRGMLGLADRTIVFDVFEAAMTGDAAAALTLLQEQYAAGADPAVMIEDLLDLTHWLTRLKVAPAAGEDITVPEAERERGAALAGKLSMADVTRAWQLLLKGLGEVRMAPAPVQAAEMVLVRLAYAARLPTPEEALRSLGAGATPAAAATPQGGSAAAAPTTAPAVAPMPARVPPPPPDAQGPAMALAAPAEAWAPATVAAPAPAPAPSPVAPVAPATPATATYRDLVDRLAAAGEMELYGHMMSGAHLVHMESDRLDIHLDDGVPRDVPQRLGRVLGELTGRRWVVELSPSPGAPTLLQQDEAADAARKADAAHDPVVGAILEAFPGATITAVRPPAPQPLPPEDEGAAPLEDDA